MGLLTILANRDLDKIMTEKVDAFDGYLIGSNEEFNLYAEIFVINEFKFLKLSVVGPLKVESFDGCKLTFVAEKGELKMESDNMEIDTDYSKKLKIGITEFEVDLEDELFDMIENQNMKSAQVSIKKSNLEFQITNQNLLQTIIKVEE